MPKSGKHLTLESRKIVEQGIRDGDPASKIARRLRVAASTVTREARAHRTVRPKKMSPHERASNRCARRPSCSKSGAACAKCSTKYTNCKDSRTRRCVLTCPDFEQKTCPDIERWPYVCPDGCRRRGGCKYADFEALPLSERARAAQGDSVEGLGSNSTDVLSLHFLASSLQLYLEKGRGSAADTVAWLDAMESELGSPGAFRAVFPVLLVDRGVEFDDWAGMERSCLAGGEARCSVYYCDPMKSNQKAQAERNQSSSGASCPRAAATSTGSARGTWRCAAAA